MLSPEVAWQIVFHYDQKRSGDPNPQHFSKSTAVQMVGVLTYKWEAYCRTNGRRIAGFPCRGANTGRFGNFGVFSRIL